MKATIVTLFLSCLGAAPAVAACPGATQMEINDCAAADAKSADARLNALYKTFDRTPQLIEVERRWIGYRDAECEYERSLFEGGSIAPTIYWGCMTTLTEDRIKVLKSLKEF